MRLWLASMWVGGELCSCWMLASQKRSLSKAWMPALVFYLLMSLTSLWPETNRYFYLLASFFKEICFVCVNMNAFFRPTIKCRNWSSVFWPVFCISRYFIISLIGLATQTLDSSLLVHSTIKPHLWDSSDWSSCFGFSSAKKIGFHAVSWW